MWLARINLPILSSQVNMVGSQPTRKKEVTDRAILSGLPSSNHYSQQSARFPAVPHTGGHVIQAERLICANDAGVRLVRVIGSAKQEKKKHTQAISRHLCEEIHGVTSESMFPRIRPSINARSQTASCSWMRIVDFMCQYMLVGAQWMELSGFCLWIICEVRLGSCAITRCHAYPDRQ